MLRNANHLAKSRHGIYYLRYPLPIHLHPHGKRDYIRISLGTRNPREALDSVNLVRYMGALLISKMEGSQMRYVEKKAALRRHFESALERQKAEMQSTGPLDKKQIEQLQKTVEFWDGLIKDGNEGNWTPYKRDMATVFVANAMELPAEGQERFQLIGDFNRGEAWLAQQLLAFSARLGSFDYTEDAIKPSSKATPKELAEDPNLEVVAANAVVGRIGFLMSTESALEAKAFVAEHFGGKQLALINLARAHGFAD